MFDVKRAVAVAVVAGGLIAAQAQPWQNLYPSYSGLAFGDGKFVAVSEDGLILTGSGTEWTNRRFASGGGVHCVAYGDGTFLAMQGNTNYMESNDGLNWGQSLSTGVNFPCRYLVSGGSDFMVVGEEGQTMMYEHEDGWSSPVYSNSSNELYHAAYGAEKFVAVGSDIVSTTNGRSWTQRNSGGARVVAFGDNKFAAVAASNGTAYTSADGVTWASASSSAPAGLKDMTFGGGKFVAVGGGKAAVSSDGAMWTASTLNESDDFRAVKYGNGKFVALGANGSLYTSSDGSSWARQAEGRSISYKQIVYGGSVFVAVGDSGVSVSADGKDWKKAAVGGKGFQSVAYGGGKFIAVGDSGAIFTSSDGNAWSDNSRAGTMFTSVAFGDGMFIVGGREVAGGMISILVSENGQSWNDQSVYLTGWASGQYPAAMCYGKGNFVIGGTTASGLSNGGLRYSESASNYPGRYWTEVEAAKNYRITSLTFADNKFVALGTSAGGNAALFLSDDGASWTVMPNAPASAKSVTYAKNFYLAAADSGNIYGSTTGQGWQLHGKVTGRNLNTIYSGNNVILAAGAGGAMLYLSEPPISVRYTPAGRSPTLASGMTISNARGTPVVTLSFTPDKPGTIAVYSLTGKQLYKKRVGAGERTVSLAGRMASNGSVIVRYVGDGRTVAKRFQMTR